MLKGKDLLWAALGFLFARAEMDRGLRCQFLSLSTSVSRAISGCSHLLGKELILFLCKLDFMFGNNMGICLVPAYCR